MVVDWDDAEASIHIEGDKVLTHTFDSKDGCLEFIEKFNEHSDSKMAARGPYLPNE